MSHVLQADADLVRTKVQSALEDRERWPGQLKAEAFAQALWIDAQAHQATIDEIIAVSDDEIVESARRLVRALDDEGGAFMLPFGTRVAPGRSGSVEIRGRAYVRRPNLPGLHPIETVPRDATGPTFESLRLMMGSWASDGTRRHIGLPSPATISDAGVRHVIEFAPLPEAGGAVLQFEADLVHAARFCSASHRALERFAMTANKDLQWLWRRRKQIARRVEEVRGAADAGILLADRYLTRAVVGRICIDARSIGQAPEPTLRVEYHGLDDALRRGKLSETVPGHDKVEAATMMRAPMIHRWRWGRLDRLRTQCADGLIDARAAALLDSLIDRGKDVLLRLSRDLETVVAVPGAEGLTHVRMLWIDGVIRAEPVDVGGLASAWAMNDQCSLAESRIEAQMHLPIADPVAMASKGAARRASGVAEATGLWLVNTVEGRIWADPAAGTA